MSGLSRIANPAPVPLHLAAADMNGRFGEATLRRHYSPQRQLWAAPSTAPVKGYKMLRLA